MSWEDYKLKDVAKFINGKAYKAAELLENGKYRVLRVGNLFTNNSWYYSDLELKPDKYCSSGDLIYAWSATFGPRIWKEEKVIYHYHIWKVKPKSDLIDKMFLFYLLDWDSENIKSTFGTGATMIHVSKGSIETRDISIPPLKIQKRIADILSAYDDLIENNLKRIKLLEQAAQNIYKEWFVNLRFPGHENTPINQETGLPEGWKEVLAKEYFDFKRGIEVGSKNYVSEESENTIPFLRVGSLGSRDKDVFTDISLVKDRILNFEDVCVSMDGSIGLVGYGLIGAYSTGLRKIVAKSNKYGTGFIYGLLKSDEIQDTIRAYAKGSTILHASSSIEHLKFNDANEEISNQFNKVIDPIYSKLLNLNKQNQKLKAARDILLPRLMNRTIEV